MDVTADAVADSVEANVGADGQFRSSDRSETWQGWSTKGARHARVEFASIRMLDVVVDDDASGSCIGCSELLDEAVDDDVSERMGSEGHASVDAIAVDDVAACP